MSSPTSSRSDYPSSPHTLPPTAPTIAGRHDNGDHYLIIIGSHRNSRLKIERNGDPVLFVPMRPSDRLPCDNFARYFVSLSHGTICVGLGSESAPEAYIFGTYTDRQPLGPVRFVGLAAWDSPVVYRRVSVTMTLTQKSRSQAAEMSPPGRLGRNPSLWISSIADANTGKKDLEDEQGRDLGPSSDHDHDHNHCPLAECPVIGPPRLMSLAETTVLHILSRDADHVVVDASCVLHITDVLLPHAAHLARGVLSLLARHLPQFLCHPEALATLTSDHMLHLVGHKDVICDELDVYLVVEAWSRPQSHKSRSSSSEALRLLHHVRFGTMTGEELTALGQRQWVEELPGLRWLIEEALREEIDEEGGWGKYEGEGGQKIYDHRDLDPPSTATTPSSTPAPPFVGKIPPLPLTFNHAATTTLLSTSPLALAIMRRQPRVRPHVTHLRFLHLSDTRGLGYFLGSDGRTSPWSNPVRTQRIHVQCSSPVCSQSDATSLFSRKFVRECVARRVRRDDERIAAWWAIDIGPAYTLVCTDYLLQQDDSEYHLRDWVLQGSNNGTEWIDLRVHSRDGTYFLKGQTAAFHVQSLASRTAYRYFRIYSELQDLAIAGLELYGHLVMMTPT